MSNLPAWKTGELPEPLPFSGRNFFRIVGPGAILLATSIGGGEWLVGPAVAVQHGASLLWIATVGIVFQVLFNLEAIRYTLYTGEPILSGIMRLRPGASFWATFYIGLTFAQLGVPALAKACAQVLFTAFAGRVPVPADEPWLLALTYGVLVGGVVLLMFGGTIEKMLEVLSWGMIVYIFGFLAYVNVFLVDPVHSWQTFKGFFQFGALPRSTTGELHLMLLAGLAATAGSGGIGNLSITNWVRDKGMGMGGTVGAIPSALGSKEIVLSHVGKVFPITAENLRRWRIWWKYVVVDQVWLWGLGCFVGMYLNCNLASAIIPAETDMQGTAAGALQAKYMAEHIWKGMWFLGLLNGFWILFSTHLGNTDILVRTITDILWVSSERVRNSPRLPVSRVYYGLLLAFTAFGAAVVPLGNAMQLFKILASVAGIVLVPGGIQILIINSTLLPVELRPPLWRRAALALCSLFYAGISAMVIWDTLHSWLGK